MYQPNMDEQMISTLYRMKQAYRKPMTRVLKDLVGKAVKSVDKGEVCQVCRQQGNDECMVCLLSH
ncbi:MAG: hypothetical protein ABIJ40_20960 [Bacteroidota bacterium]